MAGDTDRPMQAEDALAEKAIGRSISLVKQAGAEGEPPLPFASLARLNALLRAEPLFAPLERTVQIRSLGDRAVALEQAAPRTPLWAVDAALGRLLTACGAWQIALPCPGALTAETLQPQIWPGERALVAARTLRASATRLAELVGKARRRAALMREQLGHLRSSARAPQVWILLAGFAPLGLDQMASACGVSRRGTYAIGDALVAAGLARRETVKGKVQLVAKEARSRPLSEPGDEASALPHSALAEFDAAMAEIDRLLANSSDQV